MLEVWPFALYIEHGMKIPYPACALAFPCVKRHILGAYFEATSFMNRRHLPHLLQGVGTRTRISIAKYIALQ